MCPQSYIAPIFKKGRRDLPSNYRPVSLTCIACKILEGIIKEDIMDHLQEEGLISTRQHGFMAGRSCLTNLLDAMEDWTRAVDQKLAVDVVYLDFRKAFDTVPHRRLVHKLRAYGIRGNLLAWITDFLNQRTMRVMVRGHVSNWADVTSGVPQGSVLGPLLFILYVNDIPEIIASPVSLFADDTKLWRNQVTATDGEILQRDLDKLDEWSAKWLMGFNVDKCKVMHLGGSNQGRDYFMRAPDQLNRRQLEEVESEKDLGVWVTRDMKPSLQSVKAANRGMSVLRTIRKTFLNFTERNFQALYRTFVQPHLEYCIQAWRPYMKKDISKLETVQRRATKMVDGLRDTPYEVRLQILGMSHLEDRWNRGDCIEAYKILTEKLDVDSSKYFVPSHTQLRGHTRKVFIQQQNSQLRKNFFTQRVAPMWNNLPQLVVDARSVNSFKNHYDMWRSGC